MTTNVRLERVLQTFTERHNENFREMNQALLHQANRFLEAERAQAIDFNKRADKLSLELRLLNAENDKLEAYANKYAVLYKEAESQRLVLTKENERLTEETKRISKQKDRCIGDFSREI